MLLLNYSSIRAEGKMKNGIKAALLGALIFSCPSFAQVETQEKLQYESNVTLKLVQVYVLDKHGNAVTDLTKADFDLYDDGQAEPIAAFEKHELSLDQAPQLLKLSVPSAPVSNTNRKFFFFFDFAFNNRAGISKSRTAALDFLDKQVRPEDQVGVLSYSAKQGLTLQEYLTSDHERIRQVIEGLGAGKFLGRAWQIQSEGLKEHIAMDNALAKGGPRNMSGGVPGMTDRLLTSETSIVRRNAYEFTLQLSDLAKALRQIPDIKNMILFSSGIPNYALFGSEGFKDETERSWGNALLRDSYNEMCKELAGSNIAVYVVNVSRAGSALIENPYELDSFEAERDLKGDIALKQLAEDSGGKYFDSINSYKTINKTIQKTTGTYYVLGYYIDEKQDGRFHDVRVEVKRKGCTVFGQKGYFNAKPFSEYSENEKLLYVIDLALADNPLLQAPAEVPLTILPIVEEGKPAIIAFLSLPRRLAPSALANRAEALCLVFDEKGETESVTPLSISTSSLNKEFYRLVFIVPVRPGRTVCRIALCNMKTGYGVRGEKTITVPEAGEAVLRLDPPLFLTDWRIEDTYASPGASLEDLYGYDAQEYSVLEGDLPAGMTRLRAALRVTSLRPEAEIELTAHLADTSGAEAESIPVNILKESTDGPTKKFLIDLTPGELKPGVYTLSLIAREKGGQAGAQTTATFTVK
jgi:VWFA-related protein